MDSLKEHSVLAPVHRGSSVRGDEMPRCQDHRAGYFTTGRAFQEGPLGRRVASNGQVHVMDMVGAFGGYDVVGLLGLVDGIPRRPGCLVLDHAL